MERGGPASPGHRAVVTNRSANERTGRAALGLVSTLAWLQVACSTTFQPERTGRVGVVIHHGAAMYVKDGKEQPIGPFSGHLEALVADVPAAAAHARTAHTRFVVGVPAYVTGLGCVVVGIAVLSGPIGWLVIGSGAATSATGLGLMGNGLTHAIDAVNIHNDAARDLRPRPVP
jgi:hypothetical protein